LQQRFFTVAPALVLLPVGVENPAGPGIAGAETPDMDFSQACHPWLPFPKDSLYRQPAEKIVAPE
jgi:hypothetical protein